MQPIPVFVSTVSRALWLTVCLALWALSVSAQSLKPDPQGTIYTIVEHNPEFPGGFQKMKDFLTRNVHYPDSAAKFAVSGRVFLSFVVEPDGELTQVELLKGLGFGCDEEAIRVVKAMPHWLPGTQSGQPIRVKYNLPISFGLK